MADNPNAPKPPIRSPFFDFLGDETGKTRRQLGQLSREWLIFFQEQQKAIDAAIRSGGGAGAGGGTGPGAGAPPVIVTASASPLYQRYGNLWRIGFKVDWTAPTNPDDVPAQVLVQKVAPGTPPSGGNQATIDTMQGPFTAGTAYGLVSDFRDALNANADEIWHVVLTPIFSDGTAGAPTTLPVTFKHPALTSVTAVTEIGPRTNEVPDDPTAADLRGLMTTMQFKVTLAFNPGASAGFNPGGGPAVQQVRAWMRYDRGRKNPDGTPAGLIETIPLGSFGIVGQGPPGSTFQVPSVWVTTASLPPATTLFKIIVAIWVSDTMPCPVEDSTNTGTYNMLGGALTPPFSALIDNVVYWTIPGGYAWGWHKITLVCPFNDPNFKAAELTVQKYSGALGDPLTTPATDYEGIERNFAGTSASRTPYLNIEVDLATNTVTATLLTAWTMPAKDSLYRRFVIRLNNTRQDESKAVVTGAWGIAADGVTVVPAPADCMYLSDRLEIIPNLSKAELTATEFDPATIGQGLYVDDTGAIVENTGYNPSNMLPNSSFEDGTPGTYAGTGAPGDGLPSGWKPAPSQSGTIALVTTPTLTGAQAVSLRGTHSQITNRQVIFCRPKDSFYFELWVRTDGTSDGSQLRMAFFFFDAAGGFMYVPFKDNPNPGTTWTKCFFVATAPAAMPPASPTCTSFAVDFGTTGGSGTTIWYVDNVLCRPNNAGPAGNTDGLVQVDSNGNLIVNTDGTTLGTAAGFVDVSGSTVVWRSGSKFGPGFLNQSIVISGVTYTVTGYTDTTHLTISGSFTSTNVPYSIGSVVLVPAGSIQSNNLFTGTLSDFSKYDATNRAIGITFGPPSLPNSNYPAGSMFFNTADGKLYRNAGGALTVSVVTAAPSTVVGNPNGQLNLPDITGGGGNGGAVTVMLDANGRALTGAGNSQISAPGSGYTGNFVWNSISPAGFTISLTVIATPPTGPPITGLWPNTPWVVQSVAQDVLAGTLAARVAYIGTINANQVNAGTFNGMQLILALNGVNTSINHLTDPTTNRPYCYKSDDGAGGHVALVDPTGFSVYRGPSPGGSGNPVAFWAQNSFYMGEATIVSGSVTGGKNFVQIESQTTGGKITVNDPSSGKIVLDFSFTGGAPSVFLIDPAGNNMRVTTSGIFKNGTAYNFP